MQVPSVDKSKAHSTTVPFLSGSGVTKLFFIAGVPSGNMVVVFGLVCAAVVLVTNKTDWLHIQPVFSFVST